MLNENELVETLNIFVSLFLQNSTTFSAIRAFLTFTSIRELGLSNCRLHLPAVKIESISPFSEAYECRSIVVLKMAGAQVRFKFIFLLSYLLC